MPDRMPTKCLDPRCSNIGHYHNTGGRCPQHRETGAERQKNRDLGPRWENFKKLLRGCGNTICQRVDVYGFRCKNPVKFFHHILDVFSRSDLQVHPENVVGVCEHCHPTPQAQDQGRFVPTLWRTPMTDEPLPVMVAIPGQKVPPSLVLWTLANRLERFSSGHTG